MDGLQPRVCMAIIPIALQCYSAQNCSNWIGRSTARWPRPCVFGQKHINSVPNMAAPKTYDGTMTGAFCRQHGSIGHSLVAGFSSTISCIQLCSSWLDFSNSFKRNYNGVIKRNIVFLRPICVHILNGISIGSAILHSSVLTTAPPLRRVAKTVC